MSYFSRRYIFQNETSVKSAHEKISILSYEKKFSELYLQCAVYIPFVIKR